MKSQNHKKKKKSERERAQHENFSQTLEEVTTYRLTDKKRAPGEWEKNNVDYPDYFIILLQFSPKPQFQKKSKELLSGLS